MPSYLWYHGIMYPLSPLSCPSPFPYRVVRENYIHLKYIQHAFVHPHPEFKQSIDSTHSPSMPELLTPIKGAISGAPKSPHKRSFSPSLRIRMRSPRVSRSKFNSRSSSQTSNITDQCSLTGSDDELHRSESTTSFDPPSGLHLLAENFRKLEEQEKKGNRLRSSLGDKIKHARRSSKRISNYAKSKIGEGQESLMKKLKKPGKEKNVRGRGTRDVVSDTEEENLKLNSDTPLLFSLSASIQNLSLKRDKELSLGKQLNLLPPPKPPRTFTIKNLDDLFYEDDEEWLSSDYKEKSCDPEDDFSTDVLSAIKDVGVASASSPSSDALGTVQPNGSCFTDNAPSLPSASVPLVEVSSVVRSQTYPRLSSSPGTTPSIQVGEKASVNRNSFTESQASTRLQTISEDNADISHTGSEHLFVDIPLPHASPIITQDMRQVHSAPLRRKNPLSATSLLSNGHTTTTTSGDFSGLGFTKIVSTPDLGNSAMYDKRFSMVSCASQEFFSAESSDGSSGDSNPSPKPFAKTDLFDISSEHKDEFTFPGGFRNPFPSGAGGESGGTDVRLNSSLSVDDESFNTPPSSLCGSTTPSPSMGQSFPPIGASEVEPSCDSQEGHVIPVSDVIESPLDRSSPIDADAVSFESVDVASDPVEDGTLLKQSEDKDGNVTIEVMEIAKPEVLEVGKPEVQEVGKPEVQEMGKPEVLEVGKPEVLEVGKPEVQEVGKPEVQEMGKPEVLEVDKPEVQEMAKPEMQEMGKPEVLEVGKPEVQEMGKPEVQEMAKPEVLKMAKSEVQETAEPEVLEVIKPEVQIESSQEEGTDAVHEPLTPTAFAPALQKVSSLRRRTVPACENWKTSGGGRILDEEHPSSIPDTFMLEHEVEEVGRCLSASGSLVSSFSMKDMEDIFSSGGAVSVFSPQHQIDTVHEEKEKNEEKEEVEEEEEVEEDVVVVEKEEVEKEVVEEEVVEVEEEEKKGRTPEMEGQGLEFEVGSEGGVEGDELYDLAMKCVSTTIPLAMSPQTVRRRYFYVPLTLVYLSIHL